MLKPREITRLVEAEGGAVIDLVKNKHWKVTIRCPNGQERLVVMSLNSSDHRADLNRRQIIRKLIRENQA